MRSTLSAGFQPKTLLLALAISIALGCNKKPSPEAAPTPSAAPAPTPASSSKPAQEPATVSQQQYTSINGMPLPEGYTYTGPVLQPAQQFKPYTGGPAPTIPFAKGLLTTIVISGHLGDIESLSTVSKIEDNVATLDNDQAVVPRSDKPVIQEKPSTGHATRLQDLADLASSNHIMWWEKLNAVERFPGSTANAVSAATLNLLKSGQPAPIQTAANENAKMEAMFAHHFIKQPTEVDWNGHTMNDCVLHRVEPNDLAIPIILNDVPTDLPALHARCVTDSGEAEDLFLLDQPSNALFLASQSGPFADRSQMTKIAFAADAQEINVPAKPMPSAPASSGAGDSMEKKLAQKQPVEVYGIYFDFNSAQIKPQSEATLRMISDILHKNPTWKLSLAGHTDNIGGDEFNLTLSKKRSAAVKDALVSQYKIAPDRLATDGFGATKPVAPNDTVQGRALNRRVELQRSN